MIALELACDAPGCRRVESEAATPSASSLAASLLGLLDGGWTVDSVAGRSVYCPRHRGMARPPEDATLLDFLMPLAT
ncbi:hypothetical protein GCM10009846_10080 [Agrococcus versicolor]|uniref:Uncharacterized protein n=1 Tax=Agrococcus versicolor TaxID=501482 RepID=A0ABP5MFV0_9MICO